MTVGVLEAREIQLVDEQGNRRASLLCSAGEGRSRGHTVMHLYDGDGQVAITLSVDGRDGTSVTLYNRNFSAAVALGVNHEARAAGVTISDGLGRPHLMASVNDGDESSATMPATTNIMIVNGEVDRVLGKGDQPPRKKRDKA